MAAATNSYTFSPVPPRTGDAVEEGQKHGIQVTALDTQRSPEHDLLDEHAVDLQGTNLDQERGKSDRREFEFPLMKFAR